MEETGELGVDGDEGVSKMIVETAELSEIIFQFNLMKFTVNQTISLLINIECISLNRGKKKQCE